MKILKLILLFSIFLIQESKSQNDSLILLETRALNNYVDFANDNIYALWNYHRDFTKLNKAILKYQEQVKSGNPDLTPIKYKYKDYLRDRESYKILPYFSLDKALKSSDYLDPSSALYFNNLVQNIWNTVKSIDEASGQMHDIVRSGAYKEDPSFTEVYALLTTTENEYEKFYSLANKLQSQLISSHMAREGDENDELHQNGRYILELIIPCLAILNDLRRDDPQSADLHFNDLLIARELFLESIGDKLYEIRFLNDSVTTPYVRYDFVLQQFDQFSEYVKAYLDEYDDRARLPHGNSWFYYNNRLISKFNRFGRGMALQYNKYIDSTDVNLLKVVEAPSWMKTTRPEDLVPAVADTQDSDVLEISPDGPKASLEGYAYNNLVFLLDVSSSMAKPGKLDLLQNSFKYLVRLMRPQDRVSIVVYSGKAQVVLPSTSAVDKKSIIQAIDSLKSKGTTEIENGLRAAYGVAGRNFIEDGNNKIILASDGAFDIPKKVYKDIKGYSKDDITLTVFYYSPVEKIDEMDRLRKLANFGNGNFSHITEDNSDDEMIREAQKVTEGSR